MKSVINWHKYPDEKPTEKGRYLVVLDMPEKKGESSEKH